MDYYDKKKRKSDYYGVDGYRPSEPKAPAAPKAPARPEYSAPASSFDMGRDYHADAIKAARAYSADRVAGRPGDWDRVVQAVNNRDIKLGLNGGKDFGKTSNDIYHELYERYAVPYQEAPKYGGSKWDAVRDDNANRLMGMSFNDYQKSDEYAQLAARLRERAQQGADDTMGRIAARTGGLASSYATAAAGQQYSRDMERLEDVARGLYGAERREMADNTALARQLSADDYARWRDQNQQEQAERAYRYRVSRDQNADDRYNQEYADRQAWQEREYADRQAAQAADRAYRDGTDARGRVDAYIAAYGDVGKLDPALVEASGYTPAELEAAQKYYAAVRAQEQADRAAARYRKSGGSDSEKELTFAQAKSVLESGIDSPEAKAVFKEYTGVDWVDNDAVDEITGYDGAVDYMQKYGVPAADISGMMTKAEWARRRESYKRVEREGGNAEGAGGAEVKNYSTYEDYVRDYVRFATSSN